MTNRDKIFKYITDGAKTCLQMEKFLDQATGDKSFPENWQANLEIAASAVSFKKAVDEVNFDLYSALLRQYSRLPREQFPLTANYYLVMAKYVQELPQVIDNAKRKLPTTSSLDSSDIKIFEPTADEMTVLLQTFLQYFNHLAWLHLTLPIEPPEDVEKAIMSGRRVTDIW